MSLKFYSKFFIASFVLLSFVIRSFGQTTATFETDAIGTSFTSNGIDFSLFDFFEVNSFTSLPAGYDASVKFLENAVDRGVNQSSRIKTTNATIITVKSLYIFLSSDEGGNVPTNDGTVQFVGKLAGMTQFTVNKSTLFNTSLSLPSNGYTFINFATEDAQNVTSVPIDELVVTTGGSFQYVAIDNFTWDLGVLPVNLVLFKVALQNNQSVINWRTAGEINNSHFTIEKSTNGNDFTYLKTVQGKGTYDNSSDYSIVDEAPENGINYYRLKQYDFNGRVKDHGVRTVTYNGNSENFRTYPNPVINNVFTLETNGSSSLGQVYKIIDLSGRVLITGRITQNKQPVNITDIQKGMFILQVADGRFIKLVKN